MVEKFKKQAYNIRLKSNLVTSILEAISLDELAMQRTEVEAIQAPPPQQFYAEKLQCLCIFMLPSSFSSLSLPLSSCNKPITSDFGKQCATIHFVRCAGVNCARKANRFDGKRAEQRAWTMFDW